MRAQVPSMSAAHVSDSDCQTIFKEPKILKKIRTLLTKGIAGQLGKSKALGMVIRFVCPGFPGFSISERILLQLIPRVKWMHQSDIMIGNQISRRHTLVGGTGNIEIDIICWRDD
jgi:hypothetical protein